MIQVLSYFKPLHKAVRYFCNLCGRETGTDEYQTANARRLEAQEREGHYVFCNDCSPHIEKVVQLVAATETQLTQKAQADISDALARVAREALDDIRGTVAVTSPPSAPSVSPPEDAPRRRTPATRIPALR